MSSRVPPYCRQRESGRSDRAYCRIDGKKIKLGIYGSPESKAKYAELLAKPAEEVKPVDPPTDPTISELILAFLKHAQVYYGKPDGTIGNEYGQYVTMLGIIRRRFDLLPATEFGPRKLKEIRQVLVDKGLSRKNINKQTGRVVRVFKWAVAEELVPESAYRALATLEGLKRGRCSAKETESVRPVDQSVMDATLKKLPEVLADMVNTQLLTGMRPGELISLRPCDINRESDIWIYTPAHHKTEHHGHRRTIAIGPKAQAVLLKYLARAADAYCFQPRDSEAKRLRAQEAARTTPLSCGNTRGSNKVASPSRTPGDQYTTDSYRRAIQRAAKRAKVERWGPHRLRHSKATEIRKTFGLDSAQAVLGHRGAKVTEVYAELDQEKAKEVARKIG